MTLPLLDLASTKMSSLSLFRPSTRRNSGQNMGHTLRHLMPHTTQCNTRTRHCSPCSHAMTGQGMPVAWLISSNATQATITHFLHVIQANTPIQDPEVFMMDRDHGKINSVKVVYPNSEILLCWWHVLHSWQQHFLVTVFPELWELLQKWVHIINSDEFESTWIKIKCLALPSVIEYLQRYWMSVEIQCMWSGVYCAGRDVFKDCNTNMLVQAWHHLLKGRFMQGKRNQRLAQLIYILVEDAMQYFCR